MASGYSGLWASEACGGGMTPETLEAALAEIERLRAEVTRLEGALALTLGGMHRHQRDEYETISFTWNVPPSGPGHEI